MYHLSKIESVSVPSAGIISKRENCHLCQIETERTAREYLISRISDSSWSLLIPIAAIAIHFYSSGSAGWNRVNAVTVRGGGKGRSGTVKLIQYERSKWPDAHCHLNIPRIHLVYSGGKPIIRHQMPLMLFANRITSTVSLDKRCWPLLWPWS